MKSIKYMLLIIMTLQLMGQSGGGIFNCGGYPRQWKYGIDDPLVSGIELIFEWREIEPEEGEYNIDLIIREATPWIKAGKCFALRIMSACNYKNATPKWVFEKYKVPYIDSSKYSENNIIYPCFWNEVFEQKYENLIKRIAKAFDGMSQLEFVQVGGVGRWEETYVCTENEEMSKKWQELGYSHKKYIEHVKRMIDIHKKYFTKTPLVLSISIGGPDKDEPSRTIIGYELAEYAVNKGLYLKQNGMTAYYSFTDHEHFSEIFNIYRNRTKRIYEQGAPITNPFAWDQGTFRSYINRALLDCPDYLWIYEPDISRPYLRQDLEYAKNNLSKLSPLELKPFYYKFFQKEIEFEYKGKQYARIINDEFNGIYNYCPWLAPPDNCVLIPDNIDGKYCKKTGDKCPYIYLDIDDRIIREIQRHNKRLKFMIVKIEYYDNSDKPIIVEYNKQNNVYTAECKIERKRENIWKTEKIELANVFFPEQVLFVPEWELRIGSEEPICVSQIIIDFEFY